MTDSLEPVLITLLALLAAVLMFASAGIGAWMLLNVGLTFPPTITYSDLIPQMLLLIPGVLIGFGVLSYERFA
jgi:hypothetical protein